MVVDATNILKKIIFCLGLLTTISCAVDLSSGTPGASTSGGCQGTGSALTDLQPVFESFMKANCSGCHGRNQGTVHTAFLTPDFAEAGSDGTVQSYLYLQLCSRGGKTVGSKIDGSSSHSGGVFPRGAAPQSALFGYLDAHF